METIIEQFGEVIIAIPIVTMMLGIFCKAIMISTGGV